ncbi:unnamed protein product [Nippostrongylus brasiliensis]|uniref:Protein kinase domain-containing protein n=1 Tax=Nippostrongylus brasiliensis TaxID=27835 RepID=A0A0N4YI62_NIPBR|nr:unnamed protein product [Nippostrongylus brasiliensis]
MHWRYRCPVCLRVLKAMCNSRIEFHELPRLQPRVFVKAFFIHANQVAIKSPEPQEFTAATAYRIAIQTLERLEKLHDIGYLNRDVKSQNFAVGLGNESAIIYMLDFGLTRRYRNADGVMLKRRARGPCVGTYPFSPLASATMRDQAPKDDLEGWFYMIMEIIVGCLPWHNAKLMLDHGLTREWKQYARDAFKKEMLDTLPEEFTPMFNKIINTRFEERPRYNFLQRMVAASANRQAINLKVPYDWQIVPPLVALVKKSAQFADTTSSMVTGRTGGMKREESETPQSVAVA